MMYRKVFRKPESCPFCDRELTPDYKDPKTLRRYLTDKGKIMSRSRTGICMKHQKGLSQAIKRARSMALLPFVTILRS